MIVMWCVSSWPSQRGIFYPCFIIHADDDGPVDLADWCSTIYKGHCYTESVEQTCAATCERHRGDRSGGLTEEFEALICLIKISFEWVVQQSLQSSTSLTKEINEKEDFVPTLMFPQHAATGTFIAGAVASIAQGTEQSVVKAVNEVWKFLKRLLMG